MTARTTLLVLFFCFPHGNVNAMHSKDFKPSITYSKGINLPIILTTTKLHEHKPTPLQSNKKKRSHVKSDKKISQSIKNARMRKYELQPT